MYGHICQLYSYISSLSEVIYDFMIAGACEVYSSHKSCNTLGCRLFFCCHIPGFQIISHNYLCSISSISSWITPHNRFSYKVMMLCYLYREVYERHISFFIYSVSSRKFSQYFHEILRRVFSILF